MNQDLFMGTPTVRRPLAARSQKVCSFPVFLGDLWHGTLAHYA
jgi:hypothetical protein